MMTTPSSPIVEFIVQYSAERDRGDQEAQIAEQGGIPIVLFANGPENGFLLAATPKDLADGIRSAAERQEWLPAERLAFRMRVFEALARAIETEFAHVQDPSDFPNDAVILFCEGLAEQGITAFEQIGPCAVRFHEDSMETPDYEAAPMN